jgi:transposase
MAMGKRKSQQAPIWIPTTDLPVSPGHPFYARLNAILDEAGFDRFAEEQCRSFYAPVMGRPSLPPGRYFRLLLLGYFEGLDSERGIAWRAADSLAVRRFVGLGLDAAAPDHSTISRTRRLIDVETHRAVFTWVQAHLVAAGLLKGRTVAIDATTLEANAAMRSIVRRDTGESYQEFLTRLAAESGIKTPTREALTRLDRRRKKRTSNKDWQNPADPDAKITKMKDGRTHLAHKAEHAVDLDSGALVAVTLHGAAVGDTTSLVETAIAAAEHVVGAHAARATPAGLAELVADKGYHSNQTMIDLDAVAVRSYIAEPDRGRRDWTKTPEAQRPVYGNRRRVRGVRGKRLMRRRGEYVERSFAHVYDTGGLRRTHLRGHQNILKRLLVHAGAFNLGLLMRQACGRGTPRGLQGRRFGAGALEIAVGILVERLWTAATRLWPASRPIPCVRRTYSTVASLGEVRRFHHGLLGPRCGLSDARSPRGEGRHIALNGHSTAVTLGAAH